jgi:DnaJ-class molecular chaperone
MTATTSVHTLDGRCLDEATTSTCRACHGAGEVGTRQDYWGNWETETCRDCRGTGETDDRCSHCEELTLADELAALDGQDVCLPCLTALTGDDPYAPDNGRDL